MIIPELEKELEVAQDHLDLAAEVMNMRTLQYDLDDYLDLLRQRAAMGVDVLSQLNEAESKVKPPSFPPFMNPSFNPNESVT